MDSQRRIDLLIEKTEKYHVSLIDSFTFVYDDEISKTNMTLNRINVTVNCKAKLVTEYSMSMICVLLVFSLPVPQYNKMLIILSIVRLIRDTTLNNDRLYVKQKGKQSEFNMC